MSKQAPPTHDAFAGATCAALECFGLEATAIIPMRSWNQPVFRVDTAAGSYALRWHPQQLRTEAQLRSELAFLKHLTAYGLGVPDPVPALSGDLLLTPEESGVAMHFCDLTTWLEGEVRRGPEDGLNPVATHQLGCTLARLHLASCNFVLPPEADLPSHDAISLSPYTSPHRPGPLEPWLPAEDVTLIREVVLEAKVAFARFSGDRRETGVVHHDFILGNCRWMGDDLRVIDFADCGVGLYLYDLAPMLTNLDEPPLREHFIEGYASVRPLSPEHR
ncbi:MAG: phosphotransferase, partial [Deinococcota bacterium]|nr:phosphotransferase [Deinococcota bacterium]